MALGRFAEEIEKFQYPLRVESFWKCSTSGCGGLWWDVSIPSAGRVVLEGWFRRQPRSRGAVSIPSAGRVVLEAQTMKTTWKNFNCFNTLCGSSRSGRTSRRSYPFDAFRFQYPLRVESFWKKSRTRMSPTSSCRFNTLCGSSRSGSAIRPREHD